MGTHEFIRTLGQREEKERNRVRERSPQSVTRHQAPVSVWPLFFTPLPACSWVAAEIKARRKNGGEEEEEKEQEGENSFLKERGNKNWLKVVFI